MGASAEASGGGRQYVAGRARVAPVYHAALPTMEAGRTVVFEAAVGIACTQREDRVEIELGGSALSR